MTHTGRVEVTVASKVVVDIQLAVGSSSTSVEVSAELWRVASQYADSRAVADRRLHPGLADAEPHTQCP